MFDDKERRRENKTTTDNHNNTNLVNCFRFDNVVTAFTHIDCARMSKRTLSFVAYTRRTFVKSKNKSPDVNIKVTLNKQFYHDFAKSSEFLNYKRSITISLTICICRQNFSPNGDKYETYSKVYQKALLMNWIDRVAKPYNMFCCTTKSMGLFHFPLPPSQSITDKNSYCTQ